MTKISPVEPKVNKNTNANTSSQDRITWGGEISKGLDRLKYGLHVDSLDPRFLDLLGEYKQEAREARSPIPIELGSGVDEYSFNCHPTGKQGGYAFHISKADVSIFISTRKDISDTPNVWIDIGAASCWSPGYKFVIHSVSNLMKRFGGKIRKNKVSEAHLCSDCLDLDISELELQDFSKWITRANKFNYYGDRLKVSGMTLNQTEGRLGLSDKPHDEVGAELDTGLRVGQGDISLRIYDKVLELKQRKSKQTLFAEIWNHENYDDRPVTRVEFQLRRPVLRQLGVDTLEQLFFKMDGLWKYCTQNWARYSLETCDRKNRHQDRAIMHPWWISMQEISWKGREPVVRKAPVPQKDKVMLLDMMGGCALNIASILKCDPNNVGLIITTLSEVIEKWCKQKAKIIDKRTGQNELITKMRQKHNEIWPYGFTEVHGPAIPVS